VPGAGIAWGHSPGDNWQETWSREAPWRVRLYLRLPLLVPPPCPSLVPVSVPVPAPEHFPVPVPLAVPHTGASVLPFGFVSGLGVRASGAIQLPFLPSPLLRSRRPCFWEGSPLVPSSLRHAFPPAFPLLEQAQPAPSDHSCSLSNPLPVAATEPFCGYLRRPRDWRELLLLLLLLPAAELSFVVSGVSTGRYREPGGPSHLCISPAGAPGCPGYAGAGLRHNPHLDAAPSKHPPATPACPPHPHPHHHPHSHSEACTPALHPPPGALSCPGNARQIDVTCGLHSSRRKGVLSGPHFRFWPRPLNGVLQSLP